MNIPSLWQFFVSSFFFHSTATDGYTTLHGAHIQTDTRTFMIDVQWTERYYGSMADVLSWSYLTEPIQNETFEINENGDKFI